jgi:hypothetical protein
LNIFSVLSQILGSCRAKAMNRFRSESGCQISELLRNHFSLMSALCVSSSNETEGQRKSTFSMENSESHHPMSKSIVSLWMALRTRPFPPIRWKWTLIFPNPACYIRRAQTLSLFPHTQSSQWQFLYSLLRADFTPRLTVSSALYLLPYSSLPLTFPEFRLSIVFYPATNMSNLRDIG